MKFDIFSYLAGISTALITTYVRYLFTRSHTSEITEKERMQSACDNFTNAIACEIADLSSEDPFNPCNISNPKKLHAAMIGFKSTIHHKQRVGVTNLWNSYIYHNKQKQCPALLTNETQSRALIVFWIL